MIVPKMSPQEICTAVLSEKEYVKRKISYCISDIQKLARKYKQYPISKSFTCRTPSKKTEFKIQMYLDSKEFINNPTGCIFAIYEKTEGKYVVMVENNWTQVTIFSPHFLSRFNERYLKIPDISSIDLINHFINSFCGYCDMWVDENQYQVFSLNESIDESVNFVGACHLGIIYGLTEGRVSIAKTLVTYDMLFDDQFPIFEKLINEFNRQYGDEMLKRFSKTVRYQELRERLR